MEQPNSHNEPESRDGDQPSRNQSKRRRLRKWFWALNLSYAGLLLFWLVLLTMKGESHVFLSMPLFLPAWGWCIPSIVLIPVCALINWRVIGVHLIMVVAVLWWFMGYEVNGSSSKTPDLTIMVNNYAEHRGTDFADFAERMGAEVIVLVDASRRMPKSKGRFPGMHVAEVGEFLIISKFDILDRSQSVVAPVGGKVIAARFELDHPKGRIAVYAVHLPTPRHQLKRMRSTKFRGLLPSRQLLSRSARGQYQAYLDDKRSLARELLRKVEDDPLPCVVAGDLNTPPKGVIYRDLRKGLSDCFDERGNGYGYTFPGDANRFYAFWRPWLRIDYVLRDASWETCGFETETGRNAQHLSVAAKLRLTVKP